MEICDRPVKATTSEELFLPLRASEFSDANNVLCSRKHSLLFAKHFMFLQIKSVRFGQIIQMPPFKYTRQAHYLPGSYRYKDTGYNISLYHNRLCHSVPVGFPYMP